MNQQEQKPRRELRRWLIDAAAGGSLLLALALVLWLSPRGEAEKPAPLEKVETLEAGARVITHEPVFEQPLKLAVTPYEFDDMGKLLETLGAGYRYSEIPMDDLLNADKLIPYDVIFMTCAGAPRQWLGQRLSEARRSGSAGVYEPRADIVDRLARALRGYVAQGGTLYASDWQYQLLSFAFPEWIDHQREGRGLVQTVKAQVVDPALRRQLGESIELRFDKPGWRPAAFSEKLVTTYLRGRYRLATIGSDGKEEIHETEGPLLVAFSQGNGSVIFTSFHNEAQNSKVETELLKNLVFTTVTAREDTSVKQTMVRGGFSPRERNLLSASAGDQSASQTYQCHGARQLQFVLGFEKRGAELQLAVTAPDGSRQEKVGTSTLRIEISDPAPGTWRYTITPLKIPYPNFPFTVTVGEKQ